MIVYENGEKEALSKENSITPNVIESLDKTPLQCIEELWGVKFEDAIENGGGVKIIKLQSSSIFKPQTPINRLYFFNVFNGVKPVRVKNTSEFATILFDSYKKGISKINLGLGSRHKLSYYTYDRFGIDISGLSKCSCLDSSYKKLNIEESTDAGRAVAGIYHKGTNWMIQGFCSGMVFGVVGMGLIGAIAATSPSKQSIPSPPPNVDADAWVNGYSTTIRKKLLFSGLGGSAVGTAILTGAFLTLH